MPSPTPPAQSADPERPLAGRAALVTGAAVRVGRAIALGLAEAGADVVVHYGGSRAAAGETVRGAMAQGVRAVAIGADLADPAAVESLVDGAAAAFGRLDVVVNSAARFDRQKLADVRPADWDAALDVNLRAPFLIAQRAAPVLRSSPRPAGETALIVNMADLSGVYPWREHVQHGVSKAGVLHLTRILARELAPEIRVNAILPGAILPPPGVDPDGEWGPLTRKRVPLARVGDPAAVVRTVLYFAQSPFVTGAVVNVDGGEGLLGPIGH